MTRINRIAQQLSPFPLHGRPDPDPRSADTVRMLQPRPGVPLAVVVIPVRPDGQPDGDRRLTGTAVAVGPAGITLKLEGSPGPLAPILMVGVQTAPGRVQYAGVEVLTVAPCGPGVTQVLGLFGGVADELLQPRNLTPRFHFDSMTFTLGLPAEVLHGWEQAGVLRPVVIDRLLLCPSCHGLPTFRSGCCNCGSGRVLRDRPPAADTVPANRGVFVAARQGFADGSRRSVAAIRDDAQPGSSYHCQDCRWTGTALVPINHCLYCEHRFTPQQAYEMVLLGYHAPRLDPRAFGPDT